MPEPINPTPEQQPETSAQQNPSARPWYASANLLIGVFVGILIGVAGFYFWQGNMQKITQVLITASYLAFGALVVSLLAMFAFREYLTRSIFGSNADKAGTVIQDAQKAADHLTDRVTGHLLRDAPEDIRQGVRSILPRLLNLFFWGRIRNWWWQWIIGIFVAIGGLTGTVLLMNQNDLLTNQNELLNNQNTLIQRQMSLEEANRRSALVVLMSNIMDKVDREIEKQQDLLPKEKRNSARFQLSQSLIGQISALSYSFKPYRYMSGDTLIPKPLSPERGQLFITLTLLPLDSTTLNKIYQSATFESADLQNAILYRVYFLRGAYLSFADLIGANLREADLIGADLSFANLIGADLIGADLREADLIRADLREADLREADLNFADLNFADLNFADLRGADLSSANLSEADLGGANLSGADLSGADLSFEVLEQCFSLYEAKGIPESILGQLKQKKPELFAQPK